MNGAHLHLIISHAPVIGAVVAAVLFALAAWRGTPESCWIAYVATIAVGVAAVAVYISGGGAEHVVEHMSGIDKRLIENHQDLAKIAMIGSIILAVGGVIALIRPVLSSQRRVIYVALIASIGLDVLFGIVANAGGIIRHSEIIGH
jgi:hypothetical protein